MKQKQTQKMLELTMLLAMSIVLHMIDNQIPLPLPVPGVKLGLANIMGIIALYIFGYKEMLGLNLLRVLLSGLLRGSIFSAGFWISCGGVLLSTLVVLVLYRFLKKTLVLLSVISSIFHCLGQLLMVSYLYQSLNMFWNLPMMLLLSVPMGVLTGLVAQESLKRIRRGKYE